MEAGEPARIQRVWEIFVLSALGALVAFAAGGAAAILYHLIGFFTNLFFYGRLSWDFVDPANSPLVDSPWRVLFIPIPALGGLLVTLMIKYGSEKISGHGIPEAMEAVLTGRSRIQPRVGVLKPISAAVGIGTGGPFGAEGPIIQTGGAVGSLFGQVLRVTAAERRTLLACGAAAGMAATFGAPIASILLVIELLLFEFRARSFIPAGIASAIGTLIHYYIIPGPGPLFPGVEGATFGGLGDLPLFLLLGLVSGLAAAILTRALYAAEDRFAALPMDRFWLPVIGGLMVGVIGYFVPRILGVGYDTIGDILQGPASGDPTIWFVDLLLVLLVAKALGWIVALSSGTSGGVLAPLFFTGGALGALYGVAIHAALPGLAIPVGAFALVAMGAVFGASARATFTAIVFAAEVTHAYAALVPLVVACVAADAVAILLMGDTTIMTEKLARRGLRVRHEYEANLLDMTPVSQVMAATPRAVPATMPAQDLAALMADTEVPEYSLRSFPMVDPSGKVIGVVTRKDLHRARGSLGEKSVADVGTRGAITVEPTDPCSLALERMVIKQVGHLPVVDPEGHLVGYLSRGDLLRAWKRKLAEERDRELGFRLRRAARGPTQH